MSRQVLYKIIVNADNTATIQSIILLGRPLHVTESTKNKKKSAILTFEMTGCLKE